MYPMMNPSLFLMYRRFFPIPLTHTRGVSNADQMAEHISKRISGLKGRIGILLSGGIDSGILANFLLPGAIAYTLDYAESENAPSEFESAATFVKPGVEHRKIHITHDVFMSMTDELTFLKRQPVVPHDPAIGIAARIAKADGVEHLISGGGADGRFGGFAHFYADTSYSGVKAALAKQFVAPWRVLRNPAPVDWVLGHYTIGDRVDVQRFLREVGTEGSAVIDTMRACELDGVLPFAELHYEPPLDIARQGGKHPLLDLFRLVYGDRKPNRKIPLPVPHKEWMRDYTPLRPEFRRGATRHFGGKNRFEIFALERYLAMVDTYGWTIPEADRLLL